MVLSQDEQRNAGLVLQTGGGVIGGIAGSYGGPAGAVAGAAAGQAIGGLASQGLNLFFGEQDTTQGPSGAQRSIAAMSLEQAQRASELRGLSQQQAARMQEAGGLQGREILQFATALEMSNLSPLERDMLAKNISDKVRGRQRQVSQAITTADIEATTRNLALARQATAEAQRQATIIKNMEIAKEKEDRRLREAAEQNFINSVGTTATSVTKLVGVMDAEAKKREALANAAAVDSNVAREAGVVGAIPNLESNVFKEGSVFSPEATKAIDAVGEITQQPEVEGIVGSAPSINNVSPDSLAKLYNLELDEVEGFYNENGFNLMELG